MTRRQEKYLRRQRKRQERREEVASEHGFETFASTAALIKAAKSASKGVLWKASVQKVMQHVLVRCARLKDDLHRLQDIRRGFIRFKINERGKVRNISSVHFAERIVQKSLCKNVLLPIFSRHLIYDNSASQKDKGTTFALTRLKQQLYKYYINNGCNGYILTIDFSKYFENIDHDKLKAYYRRFIFDEYLLKYIDDFVDAFGEKGLGLGSETSQMHAILYPNPIDHMIKDQLSIKYYGRYMDDSYVICKDKDELKAIYEKIKAKCAELNIILNQKKTKITKLSRGFTYLQTRFILTSSGKVILKPCRKAITRARQKFKRMAQISKISNFDIWQSFQCWLGWMSFKNAYYACKSMTRYVKRLIYQRI